MRIVQDRLVDADRSCRASPFEWGARDREEVKPTLPLSPSCLFARDDIIPVMLFAWPTSCRINREKLIFPGSAHARATPPLHIFRRPLHPLISHARARVTIYRDCDCRRAEFQRKIQPGNRSREPFAPRGEVDKTNSAKTNDKRQEGIVTGQGERSAGTGAAREKKGYREINTRPCTQAKIYARGDTS